MLRAILRGRFDVLVAVGAPSILAAQKATKTIPIVFVPPQDPVTLKLTTSLARPDSNPTGFTTMRVDVLPKRVQLLKSAFPELNSAPMFSTRGCLQRHPGRGRDRTSRKPPWDYRPSPRAVKPVIAAVHESLVGQNGLSISKRLLCSVSRQPTEPVNDGLQR
jgi:hypothetical protein